MFNFQTYALSYNKIVIYFALLYILIMRKFKN